MLTKNPIDIKKKDINKFNRYFLLLIICNKKNNILCTKIEKKGKRIIYRLSLVSIRF